MNSRDAKYTDLKAIMDLLEVSNLPSVDCKEHLDNFVVIEDNNEIIGVGGIEVYEGVALIRSIAVAAEQRGEGIGGMLYQLIEHKAINLGVSKLFLLTESAEKYFSSLGFSVYDRSQLPDSIKATQQFSSLCPSSATVMYRAV